MAAIEILGGNGLYKAFRELDIKATRTYRGSEKPHYEVWELSKDDFKKLEYALDWKDEWGWWRYAKGSNMGTPFEFFTVNGKELMAWGGPHRDDLRNDWADETDDEKAAYHYSFKEYEETQYPYVYDKLSTYMCEELGASMERNVCALAVDLARANGLTVAQLFKIYEG
jgi:hypothetical protein